MSEIVKNDEEQHIENIVQEIGIGQFQIRTIVFVCFLAFFEYLNSLSYVFTTRDTLYRCEVPECENSNNSKFYNSWLSSAIPYRNASLEKCERFAVKNASFYSLHSEQNVSEICPSNYFDNSTTISCDSWIYGEGETIVKTFEIPCEDWKKSLVGTINMAGQLLSILICGLLSDRFGRKTIGFTLSASRSVIGLIQSFAPSYWFFVMFEFLNMFAASGALPAAYILAVETLPSKQRMHAAISISGSIIIANITLGFLAKTIQSWNLLLIAINIPTILLLSAFFIIPESFRWLNAKDRKAESAHILEKAAFVNGKQLSDKNISFLTEMKNQKERAFELTSIEELQNITRTDHSTIITVFKNPDLLMKTLKCIVCWFTCILVYYGLQTNSINIFGRESEVYTNYILSSAVEIPAVILNIFLMRYVNRKYSLFGAFILCGIFCIAYATIPQIDGNIALTLYLLAKLFAKSIYGQVYLYTSELFPTVHRNTCLSLCSVFGRTGGMIGPQILLLRKFHASAPMLVFGVFPFIAALVMLRLPNTRNKKLPDSIADANRLNNS